MMRLVIVANMVFAVPDHASNKPLLKQKDRLAAVSPKSSEWSGLRRLPAAAPSAACAEHSD
jgi:hypothetical protein